MEKSSNKAFDFGIGQSNALGDASSTMNKIKNKTKTKIQSNDKSLKRKQKKVEKPRSARQYELPGLRRSKLQRIKPVAYWRNERVVYETR
jgi:hypothetical protein